jgi:hypothetical protein
MLIETNFSPATVAIPDGITIPFVERGDPDGLPVIFLYGAK